MRSTTWWRLCKRPLNLALGAIVLAAGSMQPLRASEAAQQASMPVTAVVSETCLIELTGGVDFGGLLPGDSDVRANGSFSVRCAEGLAYFIGIDAGLYPLVQGVPGRQMGLQTDDGTLVLHYELYDSRRRFEEWGTNGMDSDNPFETAAIPGFGTGSTERFTVFGFIPTVPAGLPGGEYADDVTILIGF